MFDPPPTDRSSPLLLVRRLGRAVQPPPPLAGEAGLRLSLSAVERTRLRGRCRAVCGQELLLQLPRGEALDPGEWLAPAGEGPWVRVEAAPESLLVVWAEDSRALLQAAYHLGNRHVPLEIHADQLRLLDDPVLVHLLEQRGLRLGRMQAPFLPESGAYGGHAAHQHHVSS